MSGDTLTLTIHADDTGIRSVAKVLGRLESAVNKASDLQRTFSGLGVKMKELKVKSLQLDSEIKKLNTSFEKSKDLSGTLADRKKKLSTTTDKLTVANIRLLAKEKELSTEETNLLIVSAKLASSNKRLASENEKLAAVNRRLGASSETLSATDSRRVAANIKLINANERQISANEKLISANNSLAQSAERKVSSTNRQSRSNQTLIVSEGKVTSAAKKETTQTKSLKSAKDRINKSTRTQIGLQKSLQSAMRGTAGALGGLWLSYGRIIPMMAAFAEVSGVKAVLNKGSEFEFQMRFIETVSGRTAAEIDKVSDSLLEMAKQSVFAPNELAKGLRILAQSGIDPVIAGLETLNSVQDLAILGEVSMSEAATTLQTVLHSYSLAASDIPHVVDSIAKTSFIAATNVREMSAALVNAAQIGSRYGVSIDETNAMLSVMAKRHLVGAKAGTALTNMMREMAPRSEAAAAMYKKLGIEIYDSSTGKMKPVIELFGEMSDAIGQYSERAQSEILKTLHNLRGVKAFSAILSEANSGLLESYISVLRSSGEAENAVKSLRDTVSGDMARIKSNIEDGMIRAFRDSSVEIKKLSSELKDAFSSQTFRDFLSTVTSSTISVIKFTKEHKDEIISLTAAYIRLKVAMKGVALLMGANTAYTALKTRIIKLSSALVVTKAATKGATASLAMLGSTALTTSAEVKVLDRSLLKLYSRNALLFAVAGAIALVATKTITTKDGLTNLKDAASDSVIVFGDLVKVDIRGWMQKAVDFMPTFGGMLDTINNIVASSSDASKELALLQLRKQKETALAGGYVGRIAPLGVPISEVRPGDTDYTWDDLTDAGKIQLHIEKLEMVKTTAQKLSDIRKSRENAKQAAKEIADKKKLDANLIALDTLGDHQRESLQIKSLSKQEKLSEVAKAKALLSERQHTKRLTDIKERYHTQIAEAEKKFLSVMIDSSATQAQKDKAKKDYDDGVSFLENLKKAEIVIENDSHKKKEGGRELDKTNYKKLYEYKINVLTDYYKKQQDVHSVWSKLESDLLTQSKTLDSLTEEEYLKKQKELRDRDRQAELDAIDAQISKLGELRSGKNLPASKRADINTEITSLSERTEELRIEQENDNLLTQRAVKVLNLNKATEASNELNRVENELLSDKEKAVKDIEEKYEIYREVIDAANEAGIISVEQELLLLKKVDKARDDSLTKLSKKTEETFGDKMTTAVENWGKSLGNTLNDMLWDADATFGDILKSFGKMITGMIIQEQIAKPIADGFSGFIGSMFSSNAQGNVFAGAGISNYSNTVVDKPTFFPFAKGIGLMGEAGSEAVMPLTRTSNGDLGVKAEGATVNVTVVNNKSETTSAEVQTSNGGSDIRVIIDEIVGSNIARGGHTSSALSSMFGLRPQLVGR